MKLLFDQHLSWRLVDRLADLWPESRHTSHLDLSTAEDSVVWRTARLGGYALVTKDADFCALSLRFGRPPLLVWLKVPNLDVDGLEQILRSQRTRLDAAHADASVLVVEVSGKG